MSSYVSLIKVDEALILSFLLLHRLEEEGSYEVAAGWAFFHGELDLAIEVLSRGGKEFKLICCNQRGDASLRYIFLLTKDAIVLHLNR